MNGAGLDRRLVEPEAWGVVARVEHGAARLRFRDFELVPGERLLLHKGAPVEIGSRAFDLLLVLLRSRGTVVPKTRILDEVWPSTLVAESNLRFQMACLRRVLGPDRDLIKTVQGRGYLLAAEVIEAGVASTSGGLAAGGVSAPAHDVAPAWRYPPVADRGRDAVVVIDDDDDIREALEGLLRSAQLPVRSFGSVDAFLNADGERFAGCLVLDVCMPERSGLDFQADLVRAGADIPIVFISGHADVHMSVRAMKAGAVEFLTKPVRYEELLSAIREALARQRA